MRIAELLLAGERTGPVVSAALDAADASDVAAVLALVPHPDAEVRAAVALNLALLDPGEGPTDEVVRAALTLSADPDARVRDYACFTLGQQWRELDTEAVREALAVRLDDDDLEVRSEALVGLAYRRDPRAVPRVRAALSRPDGEVWLLELIAAGALSDPALHELVLRHQSGWDDDAAWTARLVGRLTDPTGPGDDILDGVAELYRRRAQGRPDGEPLAAWRLLDGMLDIAPHRAAEFLDAVLARLAGDAAAECEVRERSALAQLAGLIG